ncbi:DUF6504 family protein [Kribbella sp. NPDC003557]|uniref:DUF6504 family protein n=1 Tax=Kribbella sp. NPDC003557 TaxID=3154449 RepID=UPI0033ABAB34
MWEFDDAVEVHSVAVDGVQVPDQFLWRGRLWRVRAVRSQWTETAAWWERGVIGTGDTHDPLATRTDPTGTTYAYDARADRTFDRTDSHTDRRGDRRGAGADSLARIDAATVAEACSAARAASRPARTHTAGVAAAANPRSRPAATLPAPALSTPLSGSPSGPLPGALSGTLSAATPAAVGVLDADWGPERSVFRVEAGCGRSGRQEMFDLAHDPHSGRWQLERVTDR